MYGYFYTFGLMECENKLPLQLQLPEPNNVLTEQYVQDPKVRIQYFKYYDTLKRTSQTLSLIYSLFTNMLNAGY